MFPQVRVHLSQNGRGFINSCDIVIWEHGDNRPSKHVTAYITRGLPILNLRTITHSDDRLSVTLDFVNQGGP